MFHIAVLAVQAEYGSQEYCGKLTDKSTTAPLSCSQGTLAQIGLMEPGQPDVVVLAVLLTFFGGAMLLGSAQTLNGLRSGTMSIRCAGHRSH